MKEVVIRAEGSISDIVQLVGRAAEDAEEVYYDGDMQVWVIRPKPLGRLLDDLGIEYVEGVEA